MTYTFHPRGVCAQAMRVEVDDQGMIQKLEVVGGCSGNLQGIAALVRGMPAEEAIQRSRAFGAALRTPPARISWLEIWRAPCTSSKETA